MQCQIPPMDPKLVQSKTAILKGLPSPGAIYFPERWQEAKAFGGDPDLDAIVKQFPSPIKRNDVASFYIGANTNFRRLFLASMIWGYAKNPLGPHRAKKILEDPRATKDMASAAGLVAAGKIKNAYESINVKGWGPAYFTKYLYFIGLSANIKPLPVILDTRVATALYTLSVRGRWNFKVMASVTRNPEKENKITYVKPYADGYVCYVETMHRWAASLGCPRADYLEYFLWLQGRDL